MSSYNYFYFFFLLSLLVVFTPSVYGARACNSENRNGNDPFQVLPDEDPSRLNRALVEDGRDIAFIGSRILNSKKTFFPRNHQWDTSPWEYQINPQMPNHGFSTNYFFRSKTDKKIGTCILTIGGKAAKITYYEEPIGDANHKAQRTRFHEVYYCFTNTTVAPPDGNSPNGRHVILLGAFINGYQEKEGRGFADDTFYPWSVFYSLVRENYRGTVFVDGGENIPSRTEGPALNSRVYANCAKSNTQFLRNNPIIEFVWLRTHPGYGATYGSKTCDFDYRGGVGDDDNNDFNPICYKNEEWWTIDRDCYSSFMDRSGKWKDFDNNQNANLQEDVRNSGVLRIHNRCLFEKEMVASDCFPFQNNKPDCNSNANDCLWGGSSIYLNFFSKCTLAEDVYTIRCLDPDRYANLTRLFEFGSTYQHSVLNSATEYSANVFLNLYQMGGKPVLLDKDRFGHVSTDGFIKFSSFHEDLTQFFDIRFNYPWTKRMHGDYFRMNSAIHAASFFTLHPEYRVTKYFETLRTNDRWISYFPTLGRVDVENAYNMVCPSPRKNGTNIDTNSKCNQYKFNVHTEINYNMCNVQFGRCLCDENWVGIACDIPVNRQPGETEKATIERLFSESGPSDRYQLCSTSGNLMDWHVQTFKYPDINSQGTSTVDITIPTCKCLQNFEGTANTFDSFIPVYASMFHRTAVSAQITKRPSSEDFVKFVNTEEWFDVHTSTDFKNNERIMTAWELPVPGRPGNEFTNNFKLAVNWYFFMITHQCLIWTQSRTIPPLNIWWDYHSAPFYLDDTYKINNPNKVQAIFPWPSISTKFKDATITDATLAESSAIQGVRCMDYKEFDWDSILNTGNKEDPRLEVANMIYYIMNNADAKLNWFDANSITRATLYAPPNCRPCPDCDRQHSRCEMFRGGSFTWCKCSEGYCGNLCNKAMCPISTISNTMCGNGTCAVDASIRCDDSDPHAGRYAGKCKCVPGYRGDTCSEPICKFWDRNGKMCGNGVCDETLERCDCNDGFGGPTCELKGCPRINGSECAGAVVYGTNDNVCNRVTQKCECHLTLGPAVFSNTLDGWLDDRGADLAVQFNARWGENCEKTYHSECFDGSSQTWCGQPIDLTTGAVQLPLFEGYAGCFNYECRYALTGSQVGKECKPQCQCDLEFSSSPVAVSSTSRNYCLKSQCGSERCGNGTCVIKCTSDGNPQQEVPCFVPQINTGQLRPKPECHCNKVMPDGTYYYHTHFSSVPDTASCNEPAPACYTGNIDTTPCNLHGACTWNETSSSHFCRCDMGFTGFNCSIPPPCYLADGVTPCVGGRKYCSFDNGHNNPPVCTCPFNYMRTADRACNNERCKSTGGTISPDKLSCLCPQGRPFYSNPQLNRIETNHVWLGCRVGCPINRDSGIPCGAFEGVKNTSRCSDLMAGDPIFRGDLRPAPFCRCNFWGIDFTGRRNYFIDDGNGGCIPKCVPNHLCAGNIKGDPNSCAGRPRVDPVTKACTCASSYTGDSCEIVKCNGRGQHMKLSTTGSCECASWCMSGADCSTDLCAASGGVCDYDKLPNDCTCPGPHLKLNQSTLTRRTCQSNCDINGGYLDPTQTWCMCREGYYGPTCEHSQKCRAVYTFSSADPTLCTISLCQNGGTPAPDGNSCICPDAYYSGFLCEIDVCGQNSVISSEPRMGRSIIDGSCECLPGYSGTDCRDHGCGEGGVPDSSLNDGRTCKCLDTFKYKLSPDSSHCIPREAPVCVHGTVDTNTNRCFCDNTHIGENCSITACYPPQVIVSKHGFGGQEVTCGCPPTTYGPFCEQTHCPYGLDKDLMSNLTRCKCPPGYLLGVIPDPVTGVHQCEYNSNYCDSGGTKNWSPIVNAIPCKCKPGFFGDRCINFDSHAYSIAKQQEAAYNASLLADTSTQALGLSPIQTATIFSSVVGAALIAYAYWYCSKHLISTIANGGTPISSRKHQLYSGRCYIKKEQEREEKKRVW